jgi:alkanesulfonate monooxygenase SsuD/methylene tetrahydromethanopterin reductase-like flavin-dependent oxidoreductase (luciferase family)
MSIMNPLEQTAATIRQYREAAADPVPLTRVTTDKVAAYTLVHCADSLVAAEENGIWDAVWWWYHHLAEFTLEWEFPHFSQEEKDRVFPILTSRANGDFDLAAFDEADMIIVGDPERCYQKMCHYADIGVDELICYVQFGHLPHSSVMRTIELLGTEVIPALERYVPRG